MGLLLLLNLREMKTAIGIPRFITPSNKCGTAKMSTKKSKESVKSKKKENSNELVDAREAIRRNKFEKPKRVRWEPPATDQEKKIAYSYSAYGATQEDIATALRMDFKTLTK